MQSPLAPLITLARVCILRQGATQTTRRMDPGRVNRVLASYISQGSSVAKFEIAQRVLLKGNGFVVVISPVGILAKLAEFAAARASKSICEVGVAFLTHCFDGRKSVARTLEPNLHYL